MFKNYVKVALRNLVKHKLYTSINIFGLAIGLALCMIMIGHITYELSFENSHENKDRIYRVNGVYTSEDEELRSARIMQPLGQALVDELPEVEKAAVFRVLGSANFEISGNSLNSESGPVSHSYQQGGNVICANPDFIDVFTFPLIQGNPATALAEPFSVLISEDVMRENFYGQNPIGERIRLNDIFECRITGIMTNVPNNTQFHCDFIVSYSSLRRIDDSFNSWDQFDKDYVYLLLAENASASAIEQKIPAIVNKNLDMETADKYAFELQPLDDIYFGSFASNRTGELYPQGEVSVMYAWSIVAVFILILAIANFINLSTARSADRMREVGVRKVFGAFRRHLVKQFLGESFLITLISLIISLTLYEIFKQMIKPSLPREMFADFYNNPMMLISLVILLVLVAVLAGFYPALYLSRFKPIAMLSGKTSIKSSRSLLRKALVIFQFIIAITLTSCTVIMYNQINYMTSMNLGFDQDNVLVLDFEGDAALDNCRLMKNEMLKESRVLSVTANDCPPGRSNYRYYGFFTDNSLEGDPLSVKLYSVDYDFAATFGLEVVRGRELSEDITAEINNAIIINESFAELFETENPIGYKLYRKDGFYEVVGVAKDFIGTRLDYGYRPLAAMTYNPAKFNTLCVKLPANDILGSILAIENIWTETLPREQFAYQFLDDEIRSQYAEYGYMGALMLSLSLITITIACLGIFALVSYAAVQRTREIGVRKVLGASVMSIIKLLSKEFVLLIALANIIAWPLAYLAMNGILQDFAFRISIGPGHFLLAGFVALALAMISAGFQALKAAWANPVDTLRHE